MRRIPKRTIVKALCLAMLSGGMLTPYNVVTNPVEVFADTLAQAGIEGAMIYNLDEIEIQNGKINIDIDTNGKYVLTGSNMRNGAYVDVKIVVKENVEADLYLDHLDIVNCADETQHYSGYSPSTKDASPFIINGIANIHIQSDSSMKSINRLITVNGTMNLVESNKDATWNIGLTNDILTIYETLYITKGYGSINLYGGNLNFQSSSVAKTVFESKLNIWNGQVILDNHVVKDPNGSTINSLDLKKDILYEDGSICISEQIDSHKIKNSDDQSFKRIDIRSGLPQNASVLRVNDMLTDHLTTDENGQILGLVVRDTEDDIKIFIEDKIYIIKYNMEDNSYYVSDTLSDVYTVTFVDKDDNSELLSYKAQPGESIKLLRDKPQYDYSYSVDGEEFDPEMKITKDNTVIKVSKSLKKIIVLVDGEPQEYLYGDNLHVDEVKVYQNQDGQLVFNNSKVTKAMMLTSTSFQYEAKNNENFIKITNTDDYIAFMNLVNSGVRNVNAILKADLDLSGYHCIGTGEHPYSGVFDGENHTVFLSINEDNEEYVGFFGAVTGNTCIKNLVVAGTVTSEKTAGGIAGAVLNKDDSTVVRIENCVNIADVVSKDSFYVGSIVGKCESATVVNIHNCGNIGIINYLENYIGSLVGDILGEGKIINCYDTGAAPIVSVYSSSEDVEISNCFHATSGTPNESEKPIEAFTSGEVTYLLNKGADQVIWYQTCGMGYPMLFGDADTQTVYEGYADCNADTLSYANTVLKQAKGHEMLENAFTYNNKVITATCPECKETAIATLSFTDEEYGSVKGASVIYSTEWEKMDIPELIVKYAITQDGEYKTELPSSIGTWYIKCFLNGTDDIQMMDSYEIKKQKFQLTVQNGIFDGPDDGRFEEGDRVVITAVKPSNDVKFKCWTVSGSAIALENDTSVTTSFIMPAGEVTVKALYKKIVVNDPTPTNDPDESSVTSKKEIKADGTVVETILEMKADGTSIETVTEQNGKGHVVEKETTTKADGSSIVKATIKDANTATTVKIEVSKNSNTEDSVAKANIVVKDVKKSKWIETKIDATTINEIKSVAGTDDVAITMRLVGSNGKTYLNLSIDAKNLVAGNKLTIYLYDKKSDRYILTGLKPVVVSKEGTISVKLPTLVNQKSYVLLNGEEGKLVKQEILNTLTLKQGKATIRVGKSMKVAFGVKLNKENISKITYISSNKKVVTVNKSGKIVAKKAGIGVITIKVTLKDKTTKTLKMKVIVK